MGYLSVQHSRLALRTALAVTVALASSSLEAAQQPSSTADANPFSRQEGLLVTIDWNQVIRESKSTPTMQVVVMPQFRPGSPLRDRVFQIIAALNTKYVRLVPWLTSPRMSVAELSPPTTKNTSWDFSEIDPQVVPFLDGTKGREPVLNFSVIPRWMFKTAFDVNVPTDPNKLFWNYSNINGIPFTGGGKPVVLADPTGRQIGEYYGRLVSWYTRGGFTDENGKYHRSGHFYSLPWWEVLSELDNGITVQQYTKIYDAVASSIRKVSPGTKFEGFSAFCGAGEWSCSPEDMAYFLDPKNHAPGIPVDRISYHSYATAGETPDQWQYSYFQQADDFLELVKYAENIRKRLRPTAGVDINEIGCILPGDSEDVGRGFKGLPPLPRTIPESYWNACGAYYAYVFAGLSRLGIDVIKASQLFGYPGQFTSVSMLDPNTGEPNARYRVLQLLVENFHPGDKLVKTDLQSIDVSAQAFATNKGKRVLLINKRNRGISVTISGAPPESAMEVIDIKSRGGAPREEVVRQGQFTLAPFAVAVLRMD